MTRTRTIFLAVAAAAAFAFAIPDSLAASRGAISSRGAAPSHGVSHGTYRGGGGGHYHGGYYRPGYWGWGWGLAIGLPWAYYGWYDPWYWGYPRYYARAPYDACAQDDDCWSERRALSEPPAPTTQVPPSGAIAPAPVAPAGAAEGAPTQRPLHLNYCDAAKAYYPAVTSCPSGWRMTGPAYN